MGETGFDGANFINNKEQFCLWLVGITQGELAAMPAIAERVERVREMRLVSKKAATRKKAETPWLFDEVRPPQQSQYLAFPSVPSGRRKYIPIGFVTNGMIPGNKLYYVDGGGLYGFGILASRMHNAWVRSVAGRLKSDFNYSNTIVYNDFVWPDPTFEQSQAIEACTQTVLDARDKHPADSLATLYDPDKMPDDLLRRTVPSMRPWRPPTASTSAGTRRRSCLPAQVVSRGGGRRIGVKLPSSKPTVITMIVSRRLC